MPKLTIISGKRKTAVAKLRLVEGTGLITFNRLPVDELNLFHRLAILEPLKLYQRELGDPLKHDFQINTTGGGSEGQIQAARLALAKALLHITASDTLKKAFLAYDRNMVVPDVRRKEAYKPGDSKARSKRQKSYR
jgi:ribosomal protein S9